MIVKRCCVKCGFEYEYESFANSIVFCPHCNNYTHLECEYGYGTVVPCKIYYGSREIGMVSYNENPKQRYRIDSDVFNLHKALEHSYLEALYEARDLIFELINEKNFK